MAAGRVGPIEFVWIGAAAPLLLLSVLDFPRVAFDIDHDLSSSASIEYFAARGVQFGVDLVQNVGPFGWVHQSSIYAGYLHPQKLVLSFVTRAAFVMLALWATTCFRHWTLRAAWLAALVAPLGFGAPSVDMMELEQEGFAYLSVYLAGLVLIARRGRRYSVLLAIPALALLAFLALQKHTLLAVGSFAVGAAMIDRLQRPGDRSALAIGTAFLACIAGLWILSGQQPSNLPAFLLGVARFGSGYNEVMALAPTDAAARLGALVFFGLAAVIAMRAIERSQGVGKTLLDAMLLLTVWKHGFVRADASHVVIFFHTALALGLLFGFARTDAVEAAQRRWSLRRNLAVAGLVALLALIEVRGILGTFSGITWEPARVMEIWRRNLAWLRGPSWRTAELGADLRRNEVLYDLPPIQRLVGNAPVDFFGDRPGWVLLNHLNYVPRPMPIPFAAANTALRRRNEAFYRSSERSPDFVIVQLDPSSPGLISLNDGLALGALLDNYTPAATGDLIVMKRNPAEHFRASAERTPLRETTLAIGETLMLDAPADAWIWLEADVQPTLRGRLRSIALRPAPIWIVLDVEGRADPIRRRYAPSMGSSGFLLSPYIESGSDLTRAYVRGGALLDRVRGVRFEVEPADRGFHADPIAVRLFTASPPSPSKPQSPARAAAGSEPRIR